MTTNRKGAVYLSRERTWPRPGLTSNLKLQKARAGKVQRLSTPNQRKVAVRLWNRHYVEQVAYCASCGSPHHELDLLTLLFALQLGPSTSTLSSSLSFFFSSLWMVIYPLIQMCVLVLRIHVECVAALGSMYLHIYAWLVRTTVLVITCEEKLAVA